MSQKAIECDREQDDTLPTENRVNVIPAWYSRKSYWGALIFNVGSFLFPAAYGTLSKIWIASIDSSLVATTDAYTYAGVVVECFNEGLPRGAWSTVTNYSTQSLSRRIQLVNTLLVVQSALGILLSIVFISVAPQFVGSFVPGPVKDVSIQYVRIVSFDVCLASTIEVAVSIGTRCLDKPDVPLAISTTKLLLQIFLELALISTVHVKGVTPSITLQAIIRLVCNLTGAFVGLGYYLWLSKKMLASYSLKQSDNTNRIQESIFPSWSSLKVLIRPGVPTFVESAVRNAIYLYLVSSVVSMGQDYATAWGAFNTIRWGLIMVPVQALESTSNAFVGHQWGIFKATPREATASWRTPYAIAYPALKSALIALIIEVPICLILSFAAAEPFAYYLTGSKTVSSIVQHMWKTIDWCYIMYAVSTNLATILLATKPTWYLMQSLLANLGYCLPWAIVLSKVTVDENDAWTYHALVFGGSMVVSFILVLVIDFCWAWRIKKARR